jgi:hypothetical protein
VIGGAIQCGDASDRKFCLDGFGGGASNGAFFLQIIDALFAS